LAYVSFVPVTIELPDLRSQTEFNLTRWTQLCSDPRLAKLPDRIETDRHGHIVMTPPPGFRHSRRQDTIIGLLHQLLPSGQTLPECAVSTADGVKALDVAWLDPARPELSTEPLVLTRAPEICIEIHSPSNSRSELDEKRALYFDAGATEVWICNLDGSLSFFSALNHQIPTSSVGPRFPQAIP
jgi:Uma2 family endonuclease